MESAKFVLQPPDSRKYVYYGKLPIHKEIANSRDSYPIAVPLVTHLGDVLEEGESELQIDCICYQRLGVDLDTYASDLESRKVLE